MSAPTHLRDSTMYGHLWITDPMREWFAEPARVRTWLRIYAGIAAAQADMGAIPRSAARSIAEVAEQPVDIPAVGGRTRATGHSTAGLVEWLRSACGPATAPYVAVATTVQDVTDTWTALTMGRVADLVDADLGTMVRDLRELAGRHRVDPMVARTHGQPAVPMTVGFKLAQWGAELERHLERLRQGRRRWMSAPLGGSVGSLAYWGRDAPRLLDAFARRMDLPAPLLPWGSARDRVAEFGSWAALVAATLARIGNEVYQLQRPEIGEMREYSPASQVGSVTMPHKHNPEGSEHLVTLNTLVRAYAEVLLAGAVGEHERDGRSWKAEWIALPDLCCAFTRASSLATQLVASVEIDTERMRANVDSRGVDLLSEQRVRSLAADVGFPEAYRTIRAGDDPGTPVPEGSSPFRGSDPPSATGHAVAAFSVRSAVALTDRWLGQSRPDAEPALGIWPTPLQRVPGRPEVFVKRDDLCGFGFGGSKVRALEPLLAAALRQGADTLVVGGRRDSNWLALAALAAARFGLACHCVVDPGRSTPLAIGLMSGAGAHIHEAAAPGTAPVNAVIGRLVTELGPGAVGIARGAAEPLGVGGYGRMVDEILDQLDEPGPVDIVVPLGGGGLATGLLIALDAVPLDRDIAVHAIPVAKDVEVARTAVADLIRQATDDSIAQSAMGRLHVLPPAKAVGGKGPADQIAGACGVLLDPVFSGPAWRTYASAVPLGSQRLTVLVASGGLPARFDALTAGVPR